jgi:hypothetical protein
LASRNKLPTSQSFKGSILPLLKQPEPILALLYKCPVADGEIYEFATASKVIHFYPAPSRKPRSSAAGMNGQRKSSSGV